MKLAAIVVALLVSFSGAEINRGLFGSSSIFDDTIFPSPKLTTSITSQRFVPFPIQYQAPSSSYGYETVRPQYYQQPEDLDIWSSSYQKFPNYPSGYQPVPIKAGPPVWVQATASIFEYLRRALAYLLSLILPRSVAQFFGVA